MKTTRWTMLALVAILGGCVHGDSPTAVEDSDCLEREYTAYVTMRAGTTTAPDSVVVTCVRGWSWIKR